MAPRNPQEGPGSANQPQHSSSQSLQVQLHLHQQRPTIPRLFSRLSHASKRSFRSHSSSFEADDERSTSASRSNYSDEDEDEDDDDDGYYSEGLSSTMDGSSSNGGYRGHHGRRRRRGGGGGDGGATETEAGYKGEDTRPTSQKELAGWYMYAFAAETYVICAIGSFIPILLESLARENGVLLKDRTSPCRESYDKSPAPGPGGGDGDDDNQCVVHVLGLEINTASFAMYTFSISVLLQALLVVSISCAADHGNYRKKLLLAFAWIGSLSVMAYIFVSGRVYLLGALLAIVSNTSFGASFVLLNSFLPLLVRHHPRVEYPEEAAEEEAEAVTSDLAPGPAGEDEDGERLNDSTMALLSDEHHGASSGQAGPPRHQHQDQPVGYRLSRTPTREELTSIELQLSTEISAKGIGIGYCAGLFVQCVAILIVVRLHNSTWSQRVVLFFVGAWWALFTIPAAMWLRPRPGPPLPRSAAGKGRLAFLSYTAYAWRALFRTVALARRLVDIVLFLAAWFLLSDAVATTSSTAILFAKTQLRMEPWALAMINVISTTAGILGAFSWAFISRRLRLRPHQTILACIGLFELIPLYGLMGYLPFVKRWGVLGLQQPWEMFPLAAVYGFVLGGLSGYCRSLYGELIPPGSEAAFYALYAITDKGSSVFGPAIVAAIIDASGEIRPAFWFLAVVVGLPAPLIWFVDVDRGKAEGEALAEVIEGFKAGRGRHHPGRRRDDRSAGRGGVGDGDEGAEGSSDGGRSSRAILAAYDEDDEGEETERETR